jgi:hypothetical protein
LNSGEKLFFGRGNYFTFPDIHPNGWTVRKPRGTPGRDWMPVHPGMSKRDFEPAQTPGGIPVMSSMPANGEIRAFRVDMPDAGPRRRSRRYASRQRDN